MNLRTVLFALLTCLALPAAAVTTGPAKLPAHTNIGNPAALQRGARLFMNYCASCHSLQFLRYSRMAADLGLTEAQVMANLNPAGAKFGETILASMATQDAVNWFGAAPPDLSLTARSRGVDWIYTYLKSFYADESRPGGWNNTLLPGASMPHVLWELQGVQRPVVEADPHGGAPTVTGLELATPGSLAPADYDEVARDITTFLQYAAEPAALQREKYGVWVVLFLAVLTLLLWLLKHEYWRDVH